MNPTIAETLDPFGALDVCVNFSNLGPFDIFDFISIFSQISVHSMFSILCSILAQNGKIETSNGPNV